MTGDVLAGITPKMAGAAVERIYGQPGLLRFQELTETDPELPVEVAIAHFRNKPTSDASDFFRTPSIRAVGELVIPQLAEEAPGRQVSILEVGCANGKESYSLASGILANGNSDFHITAIDTDPDNLRLAHEGTYRWSELLYHVLTTRVPGSYIAEPFFKPDENKTLAARRSTDAVSERIHAGETLKSKIDFRRHEILEGPLDAQFDLGVIGNVLQHYPRHSKNRILGHVLSCLRAGGVLLVEPGAPRRSGDDESPWSATRYESWLRSAIDTFGLQGFPDDPEGTLYRKPAE